MDKLLRAARAAAELGALYESAHTRLRSIVAAVLAGWVAAMFAILALLWFDAALWFYCEPRLGAPVAALIAGGALLLAALAALVPAALMRSHDTPSVSPSPTLGTEALVVGAIRELDNLVREHKGSALIAAALAGVVLGSVPPKK